MNYYTIAMLMDYVEIKLISAASGPIQNCNANDRDTQTMCLMAIKWPNRIMVIKFIPHQTTDRTDWLQI